MANMVAYSKTFCLFLLNEVSGCFSLNLYRYIILNMKTLVTQLYPTLCDPMDCSLHGILQPRILEWVTISFSRGIFSTQGLNWGLLRCRQILYCLSLQGSLIHNITTQKGQSGRHPHCKEHSFCWYLWAKILLITTRKIYCYYIQLQVLPILSMCIRESRISEHLQGAQRDHDDSQLQAAVRLSCGSQFPQADDREEAKGKHPDSLLSLLEVSSHSSLDPSCSAGVED